MQALIKEIFASIPKYISNFAQVLTSPRSFITGRDLDHPNALTEALTFFGISIALTMILSAPLFPEKTDLWKVFGVWLLTDLILLAVSAAVIRFSWKIVGGDTPFDKVLKVFSYHCGVVALLFFLVYLCFEGILKLFNPPLYKQIVSSRMKEPVELTIFPLSSKAFIVASIVFLVGCILISVWWIVAWGAYRILNQGSMRQSVIAFALNTVISFVATLPCLLIIAAVTTTF